MAPRIKTIVKIKLTSERILRNECDVSTRFDHASVTCDSTQIVEEGSGCKWLADGDPVHDPWSSDRSPMHDQGP